VVPFIAKVNARSRQCVHSPALTAHRHSAEA